MFGNLKHFEVDGVAIKIRPSLKSNAFSPVNWHRLKRSNSGKATDLCPSCASAPHMEAILSIFSAVLYEFLLPPLLTPFSGFPQQLSCCIQEINSNCQITLQIGEYKFGRSRTCLLPQGQVSGKATKGSLRSVWIDCFSKPGSYFIKCTQFFHWQFFPPSCKLFFPLVHPTCCMDWEKYWERLQLQRLAG